MEIGMSRASMTKEVFYELKNANIKHIEISLSREKINNLDFQEVKELAEETGVNIWSFRGLFDGAQYRRCQNLFRLIFDLDKGDLP